MIYSLSCLSLLKCLGPSQSERAHICIIASRHVADHIIVIFVLTVEVDPLNVRKTILTRCSLQRRILINEPLLMSVVVSRALVPNLLTLLLHQIKRALVQRLQFRCRKSGVEATSELNVRECNTNTSICEIRLSFQARSLVG